MAKSANATEIALGSLARAYSDGFKKYAAGGGEADLAQAYELGRALLAQGFGVLDMIDLQYQLWEGTRLAGFSKERFERATTFFAESLSPYEMTHRSYREGIAALRQMNETLESEIHRIAHTVHDEAGQLLIGARLALADISRDLDPPARERLRRVDTILDHVEEQLRRLSHELRPTILDDLGLVPALRLLAEGVSRRSGFSIHIESSLAERCARNIEVALYRIAQEALNNVAKHAHAREVRIELDRVPDGVQCRIQDDGVGFNAQAVDSLPGAGIGLLGVRERLTALGGSLVIDSGPGRGTKLLLKIPAQV